MRGIKLPSLPFVYVGSTNCSSALIRRPNSEHQPRHQVTPYPFHSTPLVARFTWSVRTVVGWGLWLALVDHCQAAYGHVPDGDHTRLARCKLQHQQVYQDLLHIGLLHQLLSLRNFEQVLLPGLPQCQLHRVEVGCDVLNHGMNLPIILFKHPPGPPDP